MDTLANHCASPNTKYSHNWMHLHQPSLPHNTSNNPLLASKI